MEVLADRPEVAKAVVAPGQDAGGCWADAWPITADLVALSLRAAPVTDKDDPTHFGAIRAIVEATCRNVRSSLTAECLEERAAQLGGAATIADAMFSSDLERQKAGSVGEAMALLLRYADHPGRVTAILQKLRRVGGAQARLARAMLAGVKPMWGEGAFAGAADRLRWYAKFAKARRSDFAPSVGVSDSVAVERFAKTASSHFTLGVERATEVLEALGFPSAGTPMFPKPNEHGVYVERKQHRVIAAEAGRVSVRASYLRVGINRWAWGYEYRVGPWSGGSAAPSERSAEKSEEAAKVAAVAVLVHALAPAAAGARAGSYTADVRRHAKHAIGELLAQLSAEAREHVVRAVVAKARHE